MSIVFPSIDMLPESYYHKSASRNIPLSIGYTTVYRSPFWTFGNSKIHPSVAVTTVPLETCRVQGLQCKGCYAKKLMGLRPSLYYHALTNYLSCVHTLEKIVDESKLYLDGIAYARFNVTGELTPLLCVAYNAIARACPHTCFLIFTKSRFYQRSLISEGLTEENIVVKYSCGLNYSKDLSALHAMAEQVGGYVCHQNMKTDKHVCGGACKLCWQTGMRPVFFLQH